MTRQAESSIKWRFSGNQKQYVADALRRECGAKAHDDLVRESRQRLLRVGTRSIGKYLVDQQQEQAPQGGGEPLRHRDEDYSLKL